MSELMKYVVVYNQQRLLLYVSMDYKSGAVHTSDPRKALVVDTLEDAIKLAESSYVSYHFKVFDELDRISRYGFFVWDARVLDYPSYCNTSNVKDLIEKGFSPLWGHERLAN